MKKHFLSISLISHRIKANIFNPQLTYVLTHPGTFALQTLRAFSKNNGLLLAGAVAYYALLSIVPLLILIVIALSHVIDQAELLQTLRHYLEWLVPSQSKAVVAELMNFLANRDVIGGMLLVVMLFFSSLAFSVLDKAMSVIFKHRIVHRKRHFLVSALLPYCAILVLGVGLLLLTVVSSVLQAIGQESLVLLGHQWSLSGVSGFLVYCLGLAGEIIILSAVYWVIPVGGLSLRHALIGGVTAALLWEITRHILLWYFSTLSQASVVYGSLTTSIVVLLSLEIAATLLLFGAQVIAEYELIGKSDHQVPPSDLGQ
ncbi:MAG TPA: YihY/virulence factor BrkB family protein [Burkholderiaceae bacterium]|jgi:YihY family inner membrane protein